MLEIDAAAESFRRAYGGEPRVHAQAPGRVNLIGEHIDYAGGWVLPVALSRTVAVAAGPGKAGRVRVHSDQFLDAGVAEFGPQDRPPAAYSAFVHALVLETGARGADLTVVSDLPVERGWSSSAAFAVAVAAALLALDERLLRPSALDLCLLCQRAETHALGVECGLMDQHAAVFGQAGSAVWLDTRTLSHQLVPLKLGSACLVLVDSDQPRRLAQSGYNQRRQDLTLAVDELRRQLGDFGSWRELDTDEALGALRGLSDISARRLRHVLTEQRRVEQFARALEGGDPLELGRLLSASQQSLSDDYEVSTPELDRLCELLSAAPGVYGARLVGGGFGGGALALADRDDLGAVLSEPLAEYQRQTRLEPRWDEVRSGDGARVLLSDGGTELVREWLR